MHWKIRCNLFVKRGVDHLLIGRNSFEEIKSLVELRIWVCEHDLIVLLTHNWFLGRLCGALLFRIQLEEMINIYFLLARVVEKDLDENLELTPTGLVDFEGRALYCAAWIGETRVQIEDHLLDEAAYVFVVLPTDVTSPFVGVVLVGLLALIETHGTVDDRLFDYMVSSIHFIGIFCV